MKRLRILALILGIIVPAIGAADDKKDAPLPGADGPIWQQMVPLPGGNKVVYADVLLPNQANLLANMTQKDIAKINQYIQAKRMPEFVNADQWPLLKKQVEDYVTTGGKKIFPSFVAGRGQLSLKITLAAEPKLMRDMRLEVMNESGLLKLQGDKVVLGNTVKNAGGGIVQPSQLTMSIRPVNGNLPDGNYQAKILAKLGFEDVDKEFLVLNWQIGGENAPKAAENANTKTKTPPKKK